MNHKQLRIGIVGGGFGQSVLLPAFRSIPECDVVALVASTPEKTKTLVEKNNIVNFFSNWQDMLDNGGLDIVAIATPPKTQIQVIASALEKNISVFAEKPLGLEFQDAQKVLDLCSKSTKTKFAFDVEFMEIPEWQRVKNLLSKNEIGNIKRVFVNWSMMTFANLNGLSSWKTATEQGGGALSAFGSHVLYYLEEFVGPVEKLNAVISRDSMDTRETDTCVQLNCVFKSGAQGHITIHTNRLGGSEHRIEFMGDKGQLLLVNTTSEYMRGFKVYKCDATKNAAYFPILGLENTVTEFSDGRIDAVRSLVSRWLNSEGNFNPGIQQAYRNQLLINLAMKSHRTQQWVKVVENENG